MNLVPVSGPRTAYVFLKIAPIREGMRFFLFREPPPPRATTAALPLIQAFWDQQVPCASCSARVDIGGYPPLATLPCPKCTKDVMVPYQLGDYLLYRVIGGGGMGYVFKAVSQTYTDEEFAVKIVPPERADDQTLIAALHNEAEIAAEFREHPNVMTSVELGEDKGVHFFVSEYIRGQRWDDRVFRYGRMSEEELLPMILTLLGVERDIYQRGYLFRDLKPENLMIRAQNQPVLIDFGLCMGVVDAMFETEDMMTDGAPHFMPPERLTGEGESVWSEVYSLGMLMYYSLTGQTFFESGEVQETAERYLTDGREDLIFENIGLGEGLAQIVLRAIQPEPSERYVSFESLEEALRNYMEQA